MGIDGFNRWMRDTFPRAFIPLLDQNGSPRAYTHVMVDLNGVLHQCARKAPNEQKLIFFVLRELDTLCKKFARLQMAFATSHTLTVTLQLALTT